LNDWVAILIRLIFAFVIMNVVLVVVAYMVYFERKTLGHAQARMGPNRAGPIGLFQSFADLIKMLHKEEMRPASADRVVFFLAPAVSTLAALGALAIIPWGPAIGQPGYLSVFGYSLDWFIADVNVSALVFLALSSLGVYGIIMAGWSSNSKYPLLGGLRASSQVISYEITLGLSLIGVFLLSGSLSLLGITMAQHPYLHNASQPGFWLILLQPVAFITFLTSGIAETNRTPFDLPEAESELVSGFHTEYSSTGFILFFLSEYIGMLVISAMVSICFLGGWSSPFALWFDPVVNPDGTLVRGAALDIPVLTGLLSSGPLWFIIKVAAFIFFYYWLRWTLPRFRYDQLMGLCWKVFLPIILANIMVLGLLKLIFFEPGFNLAGENRGLFWLIFVAVQLVFGVLAVYGFSRLASLSWFGKAERPIMVERSIILVRTAQGGRGTIEGEARPIQATRAD
jgi:NADH-quinone oxidoreductase subunit H